MASTELDDLVRQYGTEATIELIKRELARQVSGSTLTIIANEGTHHLPEVFTHQSVSKTTFLLYFPKAGATLAA
jgi:hypothetical protein